jgi:hypothetical protein
MAEDERVFRGRNQVGPVLAGIGLHFKPEEPGRGRVGVQQGIRTASQANEQSQLMVQYLESADEVTLPRPFAPTSTLRSCSSVAAERIDMNPSTTTDRNR